MLNPTLTNDVRPSVPAPGRTVANAAEAWGCEVRLAVSNLEPAIGSDPSHRLQWFWGSLDSSLDLAVPRPEPATTRAAWILVSMWLLARSAGGLPASTTLTDAEQWFLGNAVEPGLASLAAPDAQRKAHSILSKLVLDEYFRDLLPYILDPHGPGTRRSVLRDASTQGARDTKRDSGVFYTPADVAEHMAVAALEALTAEEVPSVLDPACGTGVFLLASLRYLLTKRKMDPARVVAALHGIDISPLSVDLCAFVLTHECLPHFTGIAPGQLWRAIRLNLAVADALQLNGLSNLSHASDRAERAVARQTVQAELLKGVVPTGDAPVPKRGDVGWYLSIADLFPEAADGFACLVANPPYAALGDRPDRLSLGKRFDCLSAVSVTSSTNIYIPFVEMMWKYTRTDHSTAAMVVPLSVAYSSRNEFKGLRRSIRRSGGRWTFAFFDRTPDALFGDDVKQRCAILTRTARGPAKTEFLTGSLQRWTSRTRQNLFSNLRYVPLHTTAIDELIPKLGSPTQVSAYQALRGRTDRAAVLWTSASRAEAEGLPTQTGTIVYTSGVAYNWIVAYRDVQVFKNLDATPSGTPLTKLQFSTARDADLFFSLLMSRLTYWLWRAEGDAFHVPMQFLERIPFSRHSFTNKESEELEEAARQLWRRMQDCPVTSVNAGKRTMSFCPFACVRELDIIDGILLRKLGIDLGFRDELQHFISMNVIVDPEDESRKRLAALTRYQNGGPL